jgi:nitroreductase
MEDLIKKTRTYRRFQQDRPISAQTMTKLIDLARLGGSARNCQPWQFMPVTDGERCRAIFPFLAWAGYLTDWRGPEPGEQPSAYVLCLLNRSRLKGNEREAHFDLGIASQNLLLGAMAEGIGGCRIGAFSPKLADLFEMPEHLEVGLVIALGYPAENVVIEPVEGDNIRYWRDETGVHHVPKRSRAEVLVDLPWRS